MVKRLLAGAPVTAVADAGLARRLVEAGLAHPVPPPAAARVAGVSVVVPVRDRSASLGRLLDAVAGRDGLPVVVVDDGSADPAAVAAVCARPGVRLLRRPVSGGPAAARNAGLALVEDDLVALLDSDVLPPPGWLAPLVAQLADPALAAVAPRVRPLGIGAGVVLARYLQERSPLDMGPRPALVRPGTAVGYVPTAALLARRATLPFFDEGLRHGEDVDLVWRLVDAGWGVRYVPASTIGHQEPAGWATALGRRRDYGSSAGPLAVRHGARLAPWRAAPLPAATALALLALPPATLPLTAGPLALGTWLLTRRRLRSAGVGRGSAVLAGRSVGWALLGIGRTATLLAPLAPALLLPRMPRRRLAAVIVAGAFVGRPRPPLDPVRTLVATLLDDAAYAAGVWRGAIRTRSPAALLPVLLRAG